MKRLGIIIFAFAIVSCNPKPESLSSNKFEINRGTNIAHWLSQSKKRGIERDTFFIQKDIEFIAEMGFDHIRLPIDEEQMWDENGQQYKEAFQLMTNCIDWCQKSNLKVIIDLHILRSHYFNAEVKPLWTDPAEQEKFYDLWIDLSDALKEYPNDLLAYELMNEAVADDSGDWNNLLSKAIKIIREREPERTIVVGSNRWQSADTFNELEIPDNDKHIILSFHFYEPFLLTHYQAGWTFLKNYQGPVHYPGIILTEEEYQLLPDSIQSSVGDLTGKKFNKSILLEMWHKPIAKAKATGLPLYCGEFGIITGTPEEDRLRWYGDMISLFEENNIGYANWNYKSHSFGLIDNTIPNTELIKIVSGKNN